MRDEYIKAPMRTLAKAAGISLGSVQQALQDLDHRGYLAGGVTGRTRLRRRDDLITQWTVALLPSPETRHAIGPATAATGLAREIKFARSNRSRLYNRFDHVW